MAKDKEKKTSDKSQKKPNRIVKWFKDLKSEIKKVTQGRPYQVLAVAMEMTRVLYSRISLAIFVISVHQAISVSSTTLGTTT